MSLKTGAAMLAHLPPEHYTVRDIFIDKKGVWHDRGRAVSPVKALQAVDVVLIGLHGEYGEDGEVQKLLEQVGVPYTGSDSFGSYLAMHKYLAKQKAKEMGLKVARDFFIESLDAVEASVREAVRTFGQPVVVKPVRWGSSVGVSILHGYQPVYDAVCQLLHEGAGGVLIEEMIRGREATAGVIENLRSESLYPLPTVEIIPPAKDFFSYNAKYSGTTREVCPAQFPRKVSDELMKSAQTMHQALGLRHYSRSDFIVSPRGIYYLETNTLPGMTPESLLPRSLAAVGVKFPDFLIHLIGLAHAR